MRRFYYFFIIFCAGCLTTFSQNPEISSELPDVIPPSPTVASLMKFEEVPVNNYTGIPDISIPLFQSPTLSKDIQLNISLSYHPSGIAADEISSDIGLGWNLIAGGVISRTVRDIPDELYFAPINNPVGHKGKIGIYHNSQTYHKNNYYELVQHQQGLPSSIDFDKYNEFLWESYTKGKFDKEHDIWQYNFFGKSGRFIIEKNLQNNLLEVKVLSMDNDLLILNHYDSNSFLPNSFTVFDQKGYKYIFDVVEESTTDIFNDTFFNLAYNSSSDSQSTSLVYPIEHRSAFHLSKVYDNNNILLIEFKYNLNNEILEEVRQMYSFEYNFFKNPLQYSDLYAIFNLSDPQNTYQIHKQLEPFYNGTHTKTTSSVKKIKEILLNNGDQYTFEYDNERLDFSESNIVSSKYRSITQYNKHGVQINKYTFNYFYNDINYQNKKRLFLDSIIKESNNGSQLTTNFSYKFGLGLGNVVLGKDSWGYHNINPDNGIYALNRTVTPEVSDLGILQSINHPSGSITIFEYECNTFSHIGDQLVSSSNYSQEWIHLNRDINLTTLGQFQTLFQINENQAIEFDIESEILLNQDLRLNIQKLNEFDVYQNAYTIELFDCESYQCKKLINMDSGTYRIAINSINLDTPNQFLTSLKVRFKNSNIIEEVNQIGGGNRIKRILYYDNNSNISANNYLLFTPERVKSFDYNFFDNPSLSSGSLAYGKPVFNYEKSRIAAHKIPTGGHVNSYYFIFSEVDYETISSNNLIYNYKTKGADVGYKNVKVYENSNDIGYVKYTYNSPIDYPENLDAYNTVYPFFPSEINDFKRGLLTNKSVFNKHHHILLSEDSIYEFEEFHNQYPKILGMKVYLSGQNCPHNSDFTNYEQFYYFSMFSSPTSQNYNTPCPDPMSSYSIHLIRANYGWAKLIQKTNTEYFYDLNYNLTNVLSVNETYQYNPINKNIYQYTVDNSDGNTKKIRYLYHTGNSTYSQNRISEIEKIQEFLNDDLKSETLIEYQNNWGSNVSFLPMNIKVKKENHVFETKISYEKYDNYSKPLQVKQADGISISYIYAYNNTLPVAKLENIAYNDIPAQLITAIQNATDATNYSESSVLTALEALRSSTDPNMQQAMITTYTHKPLIGISTVTDPRGQRQTYIYDDFNRLKEVRDHNDKLLSENEYYYRTQN